MNSYWLFSPMSFHYFCRKSILFTLNIYILCHLTVNSMEKQLSCVQNIHQTFVKENRISMSSYIRHYFIYFIILFVNLWCSLIWAESRNHIPNSAFENVGECHNSWHSSICASGFHVSDSINTDISVSTPKGSNENQHILLRLLKRDPTAPIRGSIGIDIGNLVPNTDYVFSSWIKANKLQGRSGISVSSMDETKNSEIAVRKVSGPSSTSTWQKISLIFKTPNRASIIRLSGFASTSIEHCQTLDCGSIHLDNWSIYRIKEGQTPLEEKPISNVCDDRSFLNLFTGTCFPLQRDYGYRKEEVTHRNERTINCDEMTASKINQEIVGLSSDGGTLKLAPCEIPVDQEIMLADNITLQGAGVGRTIFKHGFKSDSKAGTLIKIEGTAHSPLKNVTLRDFSVQGPGPNALNQNNVQAKHADNLLVERIESSGAGKSGITFQRSKNISIRYVISYNSVQWHGISSKDCYIGIWFDGPDSEELVGRDECSQGVGGFWTENVSLHSNLTHNNRGLGINSHASSIEIAGNLMNSNGSAAKFTEPASNLLVHHNQFSNSLREGLKIASHKMTDNTLTPNNHLYYRNRFVDNTDYGVRIHEQAWGLTFKDNAYAGNGENNKLRVIPGTSRFPRIFICKGDRISEDGLDGSETTLAYVARDDSRCSLNTSDN